MSLNRKVKEAEQRANQIHQEVYGNTDSTPPTDQVQVAQPLEQPVPQGDQTAQAIDPNDETWEHKYKVLIGKYSAEVPRYAEQLREARAKITELEEQLTKQPEQPQIDLKSMTPESVVEQFGEDFAAAVGAIAERIAVQHGNKVREEFKPQVEEVAKRTAATARQEFIRDLTALVPQWREIDVEDGFTAFLDEVDPMSGRSRRYFFNEADGQNNAQRIAGFFTSYKGKTPVAAAQPAVDNSRMSIENQLAPSVSQASQSPAAQKFWTQAEIRKFYQDQRRGVYTVQQAAAIEQDILAAGRDGRLAA